MQTPNAEALLDALAKQIAPLIKPNSAIVGIYSGGAWIAERLVASFKQQGKDVAYGMLDSSFYRDDYNKRGLHADTAVNANNCAIGFDKWSNLFGERIK